MPPDLLISNARIINEDKQQDADLLVRAGRIERIDRSISAPAGIRVIDARGACLLPGMIDDQVHFREPGLTHKGCIATESRAAVAGGITSFMDMPNTTPQTVDLDALEHKYQLAAGGSAANYAFYLGATNDNIDVIRRLPAAAACGVKVFMGASTGNMLVDKREVLEQIFRDAPGLVATHCESSPIINDNLAAAQRKWGNQIPIAEHPLIRSREACLVSSQLAIELAKQYGTKLHILHVSTAEEADLFEPGPVTGKQITGEACIHFLHFDDSDYARLGNLIKCNPAVKSATDRDALTTAVAQGRLNIIATDHAPHTMAEKQSDNYLEAPSGMPLVQQALSAALELVSNGELSLHQVVAATSHNVALRFKLKDRGFIREGYWADLVITRSGEPQTLPADEILYHCGWTPFQNQPFRWQIETTLVSGQIGWHEKRLNNACQGQRLDYYR